ncbi:hypothetical protein AAC691_09880 [Nguyenibacter vanlangensis]|uniref:Uncharacterized protein n=1 Tax=Nguyenibacter vanlangensis TaxID=1216886 RepID=A0ABZ3DBA4_9PROT
MNDDAGIVDIYIGRSKIRSNRTRLMSFWAILPLQLATQPALCREPVLPYEPAIVTVSGVLEEAKAEREGSIDQGGCREVLLRLSAPISTSNGPEMDVPERHVRALDIILDSKSMRRPGSTQRVVYSDLCRMVGHKTKIEGSLTAALTAGESPVRIAVRRILFYEK